MTAIPRHIDVLRCVWIELIPNVLSRERRKSLFDLHAASTSHNLHKDKLRHGRQDGARQVPGSFSYLQDVNFMEIDGQSALATTLRDCTSSTIWAFCSRSLHASVSPRNEQSATTVSELLGHFADKLDCLPGTASSCGAQESEPSPGFLLDLCQPRRAASKSCYLCLI